MSSLAEFLEHRTCESTKVPETFTNGGAPIQFVGRGLALLISQSFTFRMIKITHLFVPAYSHCQSKANIDFSSSGPEPRYS